MPAIMSVSVGHMCGGGPSQALVWVGRYYLDSLIGGGAAKVGPAHSLRAPSSQHMGQGDLFRLCGF